MCRSKRSVNQMQCKGGCPQWCELISFHHILKNYRELLTLVKVAISATILITLKNEPCNPMNRLSPGNPHHSSSFHQQMPSIYFLLNEQPSVRRALPPVGWQRTCEQPVDHVSALFPSFLSIMVVRITNRRRRRLFERARRRWWLWSSRGTWRPWRRIGDRARVA